MNEPDKLAPEDPLRKALDTWQVPPPGAALDYRMLASYRGRMLAVPLWKRMLQARVTVPLPVAALAALLLVAALLWRPAGPPPSPRRPDSMVVSFPDATRYVTTADLAGFVPVTNGQITVIPGKD